jgi:VWFA-related protein
MNFNVLRQPRSLKFALFFTVVVIPFILSATVAHAVIDVQLRWLDATEYPTVKAFVTVVDEAGDPVENLDESNFQLFEDGEEQMPITVEELEPSEKLSVAIAMDYSGSMRDAGDAITQMEKAVLTFIDFLRDGQDTAEILKFDWRSVVEQGFTANKELLKDAVNRLWETDRSGTKLYDALYKAIQDAADDATARGSLGAVVVISDGKDQKDPDDGTPGSTRTLAEVIQLAQDEGIRIITIGFGNIVENVLRSLAEDTMGIYFRAPQAGDFERIFLAVATELIGGYIVSYETGATGCEDHEFKVIVTVVGENPAEDTETFLICLKTGGTGGIIDTGSGGGGCFLITTYGSRR